MGAIAEKTGSYKVAKGDVIITESVSAKNFVYLQKGSVAVYAKVAEGENLYYLYSVQAPFVLGLDALLLSKNYVLRLVAEQEGMVSVHAGSPNHILKIFRSKPAFAFLSLRSTYQDLNSVAMKLKSAYGFHKTLARVFSSLSLSLLRILPEQFSAKGSSSENLIQSAISTFCETENVPADIDFAFLSQDHCEEAGTEINYELPISMDDFALVKRIVLLKKEIQAAIAKTDITFFLMAVKKIAALSYSCHLQSVELAEKLDVYRTELFAGNLSISERLLVQGNLAVATKSHSTMSSLTNSLEYLSSSADSLSQQFSSKWRIDSQNGDDISQRVSADLPSLKQLAQTVADAKSEESVEETQEDEDNEEGEIALDDILSGLASDENEDDDDEPRQNQTLGEHFVEEVEITPNLRTQILDNTKNSAKRIMDYAGIEEDEQTAYEENIQKFMSLEDPFSSDSGVRKIRRTLNTFYWQVYEKALLQYLSNRASLPKYMSLFFHFGIIDERLLDEEQILYLYSQEDRADNSTATNIFTLFEWLVKVYDKEVPTSLNDLGLTYFEILRQENRDEKWRRESDLPPELDTGEARLKFEIKSMAEPTTKLCSGSVINHIAPLTRYSINRPLERSFVNKERMQAIMENLLNIDFSAFHREVLYSNEEMGINREFIQTQVLPNIILTPTAGHIFQFWQEREGRDRLSPGRIMCPTIATEDLFQMFLSVTGAYRWEMTKTTMGVDWNNVSQSSLTADYTDYVQFFKKNKDLSVEAKEKLHAEFKRFRDDRSRFMHDYGTWVLFESEGRQKLNKVARKVLSKHIPFTKAVREELLKLPMFIEPVQKCINLRKKKARDLEPRYKKYRNNNNGLLPEDLDENYRFYNMEEY